MDDKTPEISPLTAEQITGTLFVLDKLMSLLLYDHAMQSMHRAGMVNEAGVQEMARRYETFLDGEAGKQPEPLASTARAFAAHFLPPLYETLKETVRNSPSPDDEAQEAIYARILLDPDTGQGGKQ